MKLIRFILSHSFFIAFCAVAMAYQTHLLLHLEEDPYLYAFIFFATLCSYNFYWLLGKYALRESFSIRVFLKNELPEIAMIMLSGGAMGICFLYLKINPTVVVISALLTLLYALPLLPYQFFKYMRRAGVLKTTLLAITWTYVTAFIPLQKSLAELNGADLFLVTRRFLFMLMLCIIFDNRDIHVDKIRGLSSLATDLGPKTMRYLIIFLFILLFTTNFLFRDFGISLKQSIALQVSTVTLLVTYIFSTRKQGYYFYYFLVDGLMLFSALGTAIAGI